MKIYNNVSKSQLSTARFYGGAKINGRQYKYDYANDTLVSENDLEEYKDKLKTVGGAVPPQWTPIENKEKLDLLKSSFNRRLFDNGYY